MTGPQVSSAATRDAQWVDPNVIAEIGPWAMPGCDVHVIMLWYAQQDGEPMEERSPERLAAVELVEIGRHECLTLLASAVIGRIEFTIDALPSVQPVSFLLDGEEVVFRAGNVCGLAAATRNAVLAFEADDIDADSHTGWSVVGVGEAYEVSDPTRLAELAERQTST